MMINKFGLLSLFSVLSLVLTASCSSSQSGEQYGDSAKSRQGRVIISAGVIENKTDNIVTDVQVVHYPTMATASFSPILPGQQARLDFKAKELMAEMAKLSWIQEEQRVAVALDIPVYQQNNHDHPLTLVYRILPGPKASVSYMGH